MKITPHLQPQEEARLVAAGQAKGISTTLLVREALDRILAEPLPLDENQKADTRPIWEAMLDNIKDVSPEEFARLPQDGESEHDHYLYSHPKREQ